MVAGSLRLDPGPKNQGIATKPLSYINTRTRRLTILLALSTTVVVFVWQFLGGWENVAFPSSKFSGAGCAVFRWAPGCPGAKKIGPFDELYYFRETGGIHYPAIKSHLRPGEHNSPDLAQPHPIHLLMEEGARAWDSKLKRESKTLAQAVAEYKRRYKRSPPKGFAEWFAFAQANDFQLIDEFDSLEANIQPFLGIPSKVLQERSDLLQHDASLLLQGFGFTLPIRNHAAGTPQGPMSDSSKTTQLLRLLEPILPNLPDLNLTVNGHNTPWVMIPGAKRKRLADSATLGRISPAKDYVEIEDRSWEDGFGVTCPHGSVLHKAEHYDLRVAHTGEFYNPPTGTWSPRVPMFVENHVASMDICQHPGEQPMHGFVSHEGYRPELLYPLFSFSKSSMYSDLLLPPIDHFDDPLAEDPAWEDKADSRIIWRGSSSGADMSSAHNRKWSQRPHLVGLQNEPGEVTVPLATGDTASSLGDMSFFTASKAALAKKWFDFKFSGEPTQCGGEGSEGCKALKETFEFEQRMSDEKSNTYKFMMDVDGIGYSGRFHTIMSSNSLVLKSTIFPEWYQDRIQAWVHYVPVTIEYSDLWGVMAFFSGNLQGEGAHDADAKRLAMQGKEWAGKYYRFVDMQVYLYRLLLEYARVMNRDSLNIHSMDMESP